MNLLLRIKDYIYCRVFGGHTMDTWLPEGEKGRIVCSCRKLVKNLDTGELTYKGEPVKWDETVVE